MSRVGRWLQRTLRARVFVSAVAIILLASSSLVGVTGLTVALVWSQDQLSANNAESECRARIGGYVEGLSIELDVAEAMGLLDQVGAEDLPVGFDVAVDRAIAASGRLEVAKSYREDAVEVCGANPDFDPATDIPDTPGDPP